MFGSETSTRHPALIGDLMAIRNSALRRINDYWRMTMELALEM
jgi:hypothetical protein